MRPLLAASINGVSLAAGLASARQKVINVTPPTQYNTGEDPFINLLRCGLRTADFGGWRANGSTDANSTANDMPASVPAGGYVQGLITYTDTLLPVWRTGRYCLVSQTAGLTPSLEQSISTVATNITTVSAGRIEFDLVEPGGNFFLHARFSNGTGSAIVAPQVYCCRLSDEAAHLAGQLLTPEALADLRGSGVVRWMDWCSVNFGAHTTAAEYPLTDGAAGRAYMGWTPETIMRMAAEVGRPAWINVPHQFDDANVATWAARWKAAADAAGFSGAVIPEFSNEVWNSQFPAGGYCQSRGAALGLPLLNDAGASTAETSHYRAAYYGRMCGVTWRAFEQQFGRPRVIRVAALQGAYYESISAALHANDAELGGKIGAFADAVAVAQYFQLTYPSGGDYTAAGYPAELAGGLAYVSRARQYTQPVSWFSGALAVTFNTAADWTETFRAKLTAAFSASVKLIEYEGGDHNQIVNYEPAHAYESPSNADILTCVVVPNTGTNRLELAGAHVGQRLLSTYFADGERLAFTYHANGAGGTHYPVSGVSAWGPACWVKVVSGGLECYSDAALTSRITLSAAVDDGQGVPYSAMYGVYNYTAQLATAQAFRDAINSAAGAVSYAAYQQAKLASGAHWIAQFSNLGPKIANNLSRFGFFWGLRESYYQPTTSPGAERAAYWLSLSV